MCSCSALQGIQVMQQLGSDGGICAHGEGELSLWTCQAPGALDEFASQVTELFEGPQRRTFFGGVSDWFGAEHLQFAIEIVRHHSREHEGLIAGPGAVRNVVYLGLGLEFGEDSLLCLAPVVESEDLPGADGLVGNDNLEVVPVRVGDEEIQLDRTLVLPPVPGANQHEAETPSPAGRLPVCLVGGASVSDSRSAPLGATKRSNGTLMVNCTPSASRRETISSLKKALSKRPR